MNAPRSDVYPLAIRIIHWLMALGFLFMWVCGYSMTSLVADDSPLQETLFGLHISVGVSLLFLLALRIALRLTSRIPPLPDGLSSWEKTGSHLGHFGLYLFPALIILIGWAETDFGGHGVTWFGVAMPKVFPTMQFWNGIDLDATTVFLHKWGAYAMLALAAIHVAAVIKHKYFDGHDVLGRMAIK